MVAVQLLSRVLLVYWVNAERFDRDSSVIGAVLPSPTSRTLCCYGVLLLELYYELTSVVLCCRDK